MCKVDQMCMQKPFGMVVNESGLRTLETEGLNRMLLLSAADYYLKSNQFKASWYWMSAPWKRAQFMPTASSEQPILLFLEPAPGFHTQCRTHKGGVRGGAPVNASLAWCNGSVRGRAQNAEKGLLIRLQHGWKPPILMGRHGQTGIGLSMA